MKKLALLTILMTSPTFAAGFDFNQELLQTISEMPEGGRYSTRSEAFQALQGRVQILDGVLAINHQLVGPSFCSSATYPAFLKTLEKIQGLQPEIFDPEAVDLLKVTHEGRYLDDGFGIWGRWNANGPGTAALFYDLDIGDNFADDNFEHAQAGDFLKIFWTWGRGVGRYERGHSVVFTKVLPERATGANVEQVCFWSSHGYDDGRESGMGEKCVPRSDIQEMIFSRMTRPENINLVLGDDYQFENEYLASLLDTESTIEEAREKTGTVVLSPRK